MMNIFVVALSIGIVLPTLLLALLWPRKELRNPLLMLLLFQALQIGSEATLAHQQLRYVIKYSAILFVTYRILQIINLWQKRSLVDLDIKFKAVFFKAVVAANFIFWIVVWLRLALRIWSAFYPA